MTVTEAKVSPSKIRKRRKILDEKSITEEDWQVISTYDFGTHQSVLDKLRLSNNHPVPAGLLEHPTIDNLNIKLSRFGLPYVVRTTDRDGRRVFGTNWHHSYFKLFRCEWQ